MIYLKVHRSDTKFHILLYQASSGQIEFCSPRLKGMITPQKCALKEWCATFQECLNYTPRPTKCSVAAFCEIMLWTFSIFLVRWYCGDPFKLRVLLEVGMNFSRNVKTLRSIV